MSKLSRQSRFKTAARLTLAAASTVFLVLPAGAAAINIPGAAANDIAISPAYPRGNEEVTAEVRNFFVDLKRSQVLWFLNNAPLRQGVGLTRVSFPAGKVGETTTVEAILRDPNGRVVELKKTFRPAEVDLLWEGISYTPPFYKGRALHSYGGTVRITALPNFVNDDKSKPAASRLLYSWKVDGKLARDASGQGKNGFILNPAGPFQERLVEVIVTDPVSEVGAESAIVLTASEPSLIAYENHRVYGTLFNKALTGTVNLNGDEIIIKVAPFFFSVNGGLFPSYKWILNNRETDEIEDEVTFRRENKEMTGSASIKARATLINEKLFQTAGTFFLVNLQPAGGSGDGGFPTAGKPASR